MPTQLTVLKFNTPAGAEDMLELLKAYQTREFLKLNDAVVVTKDDHQQVHVRQPLGANQGKGAVLGGVSGALVGLVGGPVGAAVGLVAGALAGGAAAATREPGYQEDELESLAMFGLEPGESGLLAYYDEIWSDQIERLVKEFNATGSGQIVTARHQAAPEQPVSQEKIEASYQSWQVSMDKQRADLAALRVQAGTAVQSERDKVQQQIAKANAELDQLYQNVLQTLHGWQQQIDTNINHLEAEAGQANANAKVALDQHLASARAARQTLRSNVQATLAAMLADLKSDLERLQAQVATAQSQFQAEWQQQIAQLQAEREAEQQRFMQLENAEGAAWDTMSQRIQDAINTYRAEVRQAEAHYADPM